MQSRCLLLYNAGLSFLKKYKNDILLIVIILILAGGVWVYTLCNREAGGMAVVTVDGKVEDILPLSKDTALGINADYLGTGETGFANVIVVENGRVCVKDADCPDQICVRTGWIEYDGQMIVCLPHKLIVTVVGGETDTDAMTQ